ncbi:MAG: hypothetical protein IT478_09670 [Xanthomonadales bacterium]|nr:hypothetical protein [Xanthomonadales bacterium]
MAENATTHLTALSEHILPSSATMVGVCITSLSIVKLAKFTGLAVWVSHFLALCSVVFLVSSLFSYAAMRNRGHARMERLADGTFLVGLTVLSLSTVFLAIAID